MLLGSWKGCSLPGTFLWTDGPCKILDIWFGPDLLLDKNWCEVVEKVVAAIDLWLRRKVPIKCRAEVCNLYIYLLVLTVFSTSTPIHISSYSRKGPVLVYLGQTDPSVASGNLSPSPVQRQLYSTVRGIVTSFFASQFPWSDLCAIWWNWRVLEERRQQAVY